MNERIAPFLIGRATTVLQAMRQLEDTAQKILFVIDDGGVLVGSLTDGDIRRWILAGGKLDDPIDNVCCGEPSRVGEGYDLATVLQLMIEQEIGCVPVVDDEDRVVDLLFWERVFTDGSEHKPPAPIDLPVVIMAGRAA